MLYGGYLVKREHCCRCATAGRPLYTMEVAPGRKPWLKLATPGLGPANAACSECWEEVADVIVAHFQVAYG